MPGPPILVAGEVLIDLMPTAAEHTGAIGLEGRFGGSPANVAVGLARLGVPVSFAGRLSRHGYGPWLRRHLGLEGVALDAVVEADEPCSLAVVSLDPSGVATYELYGPGSADWAWRPEELPDPSSLSGGAVHTGSLATALAPGAGVLTDWLHRLRRRGDVVVSYDPNIRPSLVGTTDLWSRIVGPVLGAAHLVKLSEEDLEAVHPELDAGRAARRWLDSSADGSGPEIVVVTQGGAGASAWHRDGRTLQRPAPAVAIVDTVGAGDAFTAGFLASLRESGWLSPHGLATIDDAGLGAALEQGTLVAGLTCGRKGADPPRRAELATGPTASMRDLRSGR